MNNTNLPVQELDFDQIKSALKDHLRSQSEFQDYDFEGSGLNILLDVLAYNTHYMGMYGHMLANETFIDSAQLKSSMTSKAKMLNYVPKSKQAARATVTIIVDVNAGNEPDSRKVVIERGTTFKSTNNTSDNRIFSLIDDLYIYNQASLGSYDYTSEEVEIYAGTFESERFEVDGTITNQRFIIRNKDIDIGTLRVDVYPDKNATTYETYNESNDYTQVNRNSLVYTIGMNEDEYYELFFGNDVFGKSLDNGNMIKVSYVATTGEEGNNARTFISTGYYTYASTDYDLTVATISNSDGGMEAEGLEDLRYNIPYHYRRQNRTVTVDDYKNILMTEYRNINSINVWGGEDHEPKTYGKVFVCIKPKFGEVLSSASKKLIKEKILKKYNVATIEVEIVDPEYLYVNLDVFVRYNPLNTTVSSGQLKSLVEAAITDYDTNVLNRFGSFYSDVDMNQRIKSVDGSVLTSYTEITLEKRFTPVLNSLDTYYVDFANQLEEGTVKSDVFNFRLLKSYFVDDGKGNIVIYYWDSFNNKYRLYKDETFGSVEYNTGIVRLSNIGISEVYAQNGIVSAYAEPTYPDFFTKRNNVVVIDDTTVTVTEDFENKSNKS